MSKQWNNTEVPRKTVFHLVSQAFDEIFNKLKEHTQTRKIFLNHDSHKDSLSLLGFSNTPSQQDAHVWLSTEARVGWTSGSLDLTRTTSSSDGVWCQNNSFPEPRNLTEKNGARAPFTQTFVPGYLKAWERNVIVLQ